ncbi:MAG: UDP-3-O-[3-hydroxymyristoyl] N-acetylglucosamine deacetylase [Labilithrix sp.]|nr:UDP-3-O-[3-hydroxymyristoyl] N-acetylglucosamine deacetylase [Labilithrix sp.]
MIRGQGLHSGRPSSVAFERCDGPVRVRAGGREVPLAELVVVDTTRSTTLGTRDGTLRIGTVEHVLAALAGAGVHRGITIVVDGPEMPLADGGAAAFFDALSGVMPPAQDAPRLVVARAGRVVVGASTYDFAPGERIDVSVEIDFGRADLVAAAEWRGDPADFRARVATARTFGFEHEIGELLARGLASHVTPESVVVLGEGRVLSAGAPFEADEPARHKLLDLLGDLYVHGGPPRGSVRAVRPGHAATHAVIERARDAGLLAP